MQENKVFGSPSDWLFVIGTICSAIGLMRLASGIMGEAAGWTEAGAPASIGGEGNLPIAAAILGAGLLIIAIGFIIRSRK